MRDELIEKNTRTSFLLKKLWEHYNSGKGMSEDNKTFTNLMWKIHKHIREYIKWKIIEKEEIFQCEQLILEFQEFYRTVFTGCEYTSANEKVDIKGGEKMNTNDNMIVAQGLIIDIKKAEEERQNIKEQLGLAKKTLDSKVDLLAHSLEAGLELRAMTKDDMYIGQTVFYPYVGVDIAVVTELLDEYTYGKDRFMTKYGIMSMQGSYVLDISKDTESLVKELVEESHSMLLLVNQLNKQKQSVKEGMLMTKEEIVDYNNHVRKVHKYIEKYRNWQVNSVNNTIDMPKIDTIDAICVEYSRL